MQHIAFLVTPEPGSDGSFAIPFLAPWIRATAAAVCDEVREIRADEQPPPIDGITLWLDATMPLTTEDELRALMRAAKDNAGTAFAAGHAGRLPRCVAGDGDAVEVRLGVDATVTIREPSHLAAALTILRRRKNAALMESGVILLDPERTYIDPDVSIGTGTVVHANNTLTGGTVIGFGCTLLPGSRVHASTVGDGTVIEHSVLMDCVVGSRTTVGPFAYLRPDTRVGDGCRVGDFVEIKNSTIGDETKISHLTYVGDSDLGQRINLGCGVVFVNYDGRKKHRTAVDNDAFIGCNVNLVSPVHIGKGAYVAAGSTVTDDVPDEALAIARARQETKEGWAARRRQDGKL